MNDVMSPREFDDYVGLMGRLLKLRASQREAIADELRLHLEERFSALTEQGVGPQEAISMALAEFGDAAALAAQFSSIAKLQKRRWIMRIGVSTAVTVLLALAVTVSMWPDRTGCGVGSTAQAQQTDKKQESPAMFSESNANVAAMAKLEKLGTVQFNENSLEEAISFFAKLTDLQFHLDKVALVEEGVEADAPVTLNLRDVPIEMLLRLMLKPLHLTYMLDHGVVIITSCNVEQKAQEIRVYRVDDLVRADEKTEKEPLPKTPLPGLPSGEKAVSGTGQKNTTSIGSTNDQTYLAQIGGGGGGLGGAPMGGAYRDLLTQNTCRDMDALMNLIKSVVQPDSWSDLGGIGVIEQYRGVLVVSQTTRNQMKIEKLLTELRQAMRFGGKTSETP